MLNVFFFNDTATTEIYTLSLHDALPIYSDLIASATAKRPAARLSMAAYIGVLPSAASAAARSSRPSSSIPRSEEHTSELQSRQYLVCRLLLEKKTTSRPAYLRAFRRRDL